MPSLLVPSVPFYRNPEFQPGLAALVEFLMERIYSGRSIGRIYDHVAVNGTLAGCNWIEPEDEAAAEECFVNALPEVPFDNPAWGSDEDLDDLDAIVRNFDLGDDEGEDTGEFPALVVEPNAAAGLVALPPIAGGAPEPFEPTAEDWEDYRRWSEELEARRRSHEYLDRFNEERQDWTEVPA